MHPSKGHFCFKRGEQNVTSLFCEEEFEAIERILAGGRRNDMLRGELDRVVAYYSDHNEVGVCEKKQRLLALRRAADAYRAAWAAVLEMGNDSDAVAVSAAYDGSEGVTQEAHRCSMTSTICEAIVAKLPNKRRRDLTRGMLILRAIEIFEWFDPGGGFDLNYEMSDHCPHPLLVMAAALAPSHATRRAHHGGLRTANVSYYVGNRNEPAGYTHPFLDFAEIVMAAYSRARGERPKDRSALGAELDRQLDQMRGRHRRRNRERAHSRPARRLAS
jgi:hypothetical protein